MKKLLKKLSVMRLEERVLFDAAAAAAAVEADNHAQEAEELQQQQQQLQEQMAAEEAARQARQAEAAAAAEEPSVAEEAPAADDASAESGKEAAAVSEVAAAVEAIAGAEGIEANNGNELLETSSDDVVGETLEGLNNVEVEADAETESSAVPVVEETESEVVTLSAEEIAASIANGTRHELVIVSDSVKDSKTIIDGLAEGTEVLVLDRNSDVLDQINEYLDNTNIKYDAIHVVSHGGDGYLILNNSIIDMESLEADPASWAAIGEHVAQDGDILLYGCNVTNSENGKAFAHQIASLTGADVAASTHSIGGAYGWELDYVHGTVDSGIITVDTDIAKLGSYTLVEYGSAGSGANSRVWQNHAGQNSAAGTYWGFATSTTLGSGTSAVKAEIGQLYSETVTVGENGQITRAYAVVADTGNLNYVMTQAQADGLGLEASSIAITSSNVTADDFDLGNILGAINAGGLTITVDSDVDVNYSVGGYISRDFAFSGGNNVTQSQAAGEFLGVRQGAAVSFTDAANLTLADVDIAGDGSSFTISGTVGNIVINDRNGDSRAVYLSGVGSQFVIDAHASGFEAGVSNVIINGDVDVVGATFTVELEGNNSTKAESKFIVHGDFYARSSGMSNAEVSISVKDVFNPNLSLDGDVVDQHYDINQDSTATNDTQNYWLTFDSTSNDVPRGDSAVIFDGSVYVNAEGHRGGDLHHASLNIDGGENGVVNYIFVKDNFIVGGAETSGSFSASDFYSFYFDAGNGKVFSIGKDDRASFTAEDRAVFRNGGERWFFGSRNRVTVDRQVEIGQGATLTINNLMMDIRDSVTGNNVDFSHLGTINGEDSELTFREGVVISGTDYAGGKVYLDSVRYENGVAASVARDGGVGNLDPEFHFYYGEYGNLGMWLDGRTDYKIDMDLLQEISIANITFINKNNDEGFVTLVQGGTGVMTGSTGAVTMQGEFNLDAAQLVNTTFDFEIGSHVNVIYNRASEQYVLAGNYYELTISNTADKILAGNIVVGVSIDKINELSKYEAKLDSNGGKDATIAARKLTEAYRGGISLGAGLRTMGYDVDFFGYTYASTEKAKIYSENASGDVAGRVSYHVAQTLVNMDRTVPVTVEAFGTTMTVNVNPWDSTDGLGLSKITHTTHGVGPGVTGHQRTAEAYRAFFGGTYNNLTIDTMATLPPTAGYQWIPSEEITFTMDDSVRIYGDFLVTALWNNNTTTQHHYFSVNVTSDVTFVGNDNKIVLDDANLHFSGSVSGNFKGISATRDEYYSANGVIEKSSLGASERTLSLVFDQRVGQIDLLHIDGVSVTFNSDVESIDYITVGTPGVHTGKVNTRDEILTFNGDVELVRSVVTTRQFDDVKPIFNFNGQTTGTAIFNSPRSVVNFNHRGDLTIFQGVYDDLYIVGEEEEFVDGVKTIIGNTVVGGVFNANRANITIQSGTLSLETFYEDYADDYHRPNFTVNANASLEFRSANTEGIRFYGTIESAGTITILGRGYFYGDITLTGEGNMIIDGSAEGSHFSRVINRGSGFDIVRNIRINELHNYGVITVHNNNVGLDVYNHAGGNLVFELNSGTVGANGYEFGFTYGENGSSGEWEDGSSYQTGDEVRHGNIYVAAGDVPAGVEPGVEYWREIDAFVSSDSKTYKQGDVVYSGTTVYRATVSYVPGRTSITDTNYWEVVGTVAAYANGTEYNAGSLVNVGTKVYVAMTSAAAGLRPDTNYWNPVNTTANRLINGGTITVNNGTLNLNNFTQGDKNAETGRWTYGGEGFVVGQNGTLILGATAAELNSGNVGSPALDSYLGNITNSGTVKVDAAVGDISFGGDVTNRANSKFILANSEATFNGSFTHNGSLSTENASAIIFNSTVAGTGTIGGTAGYDGTVAYSGAEQHILTGIYNGEVTLAEGVKTVDGNIVFNGNVDNAAVIDGSDISIRFNGDTQGNGSFAGALDVTYATVSTNIYAGSYGDLVINSNTREIGVGFSAEKLTLSGSNTFNGTDAENIAALTVSGDIILGNGSNTTLGEFSSLNAGSDTAAVIKGGQNGGTLTFSTNAIGSGVTIFEEGLNAAVTYDYAGTGDQIILSGTYLSGMTLSGSNKVVNSTIAVEGLLRSDASGQLTIVNGGTLSIIGTIQADILYVDFGGTLSLDLTGASTLGTVGDYVTTDDVTGSITGVSNTGVVFGGELNLSGSGTLTVYGWQDVGSLGIINVNSGIINFAGVPDDVDSDPADTLGYGYVNATINNNAGPANVVDDNGRLQNVWVTINENKFTSELTGYLANSKFRVVGGATLTVDHFSVWNDINSDGVRDEGEAWLITNTIEAFSLLDGSTLIFDLQGGYFSEGVDAIITVKDIYVESGNQIVISDGSTVEFSNNANIEGTVSGSGNAILMEGTYVGDGAFDMAGGQVTYGENVFIYNGVYNDLKISSNKITSNITVNGTASLDGIMTGNGKVTFNGATNGVATFGDIASDKTYTGLVTYGENAGAVYGGQYNNISIQGDHEVSASLKVNLIEGGTFKLDSTLTLNDKVVLTINGLTDANEAGNNGRIEGADTSSVIYGYNADIYGGVYGNLTANGTEYLLSNDVTVNGSADLKGTFLGDVNVEFNGETKGSAVFGVIGDDTRVFGGTVSYADVSKTVYGGNYYDLVIDGDHTLKVALAVNNSADINGSLSGTADVTFAQGATLQGGGSFGASGADYQGTVTYNGVDYVYGGFYSGINFANGNTVSTDVAASGNVTLAGALALTADGSMAFNGTTDANATGPRNTGVINAADGSSISYAATADVYNGTYGDLTIVGDHLLLVNGEAPEGIVVNGTATLSDGVLTGNTKVTFNGTTAGNSTFGDINSDTTYTGTVTYGTAAGTIFGGQYNSINIAGDASDIHTLIASLNVTVPSGGSFKLSSQLVLEDGVTLTLNGVTDANEAGNTGSISGAADSTVIYSGDASVYGGTYGNLTFTGVGYDLHNDFTVANAALINGNITGDAGVVFNGAVSGNAVFGNIESGIIYNGSVTYAPSAAQAQTVFSGNYGTLNITGDHELTHKIIVNTAAAFNEGVMTGNVDVIFENGAVLTGTNGTFGTDADNRYQGTVTYNGVTGSTGVFGGFYGDLILNNGNSTSAVIDVVDARLSGLLTVTGNGSINFAGTTDAAAAGNTGSISAEDGTSITYADTAALYGGTYGALTFGSDRELVFDMTVNGLATLNGNMSGSANMTFNAGIGGNAQFGSDTKAYAGQVTFAGADSSVYGGYYTNLILTGNHLLENDIVIVENGSASISDGVMTGSANVTFNGKTSGNGTFGTADSTYTGEVVYSPAASMVFGGYYDDLTINGDHLLSADLTVVSGGKVTLNGFMTGSANVVFNGETFGDADFGTADLAYAGNVAYSSEAVLVYDGHYTNLAIDGDHTLIGDFMVDGYAYITGVQTLSEGTVLTFNGTTNAGEAGAGTLKNNALAVYSIVNYGASAGVFGGEYADLTITGDHTLVNDFTVKGLAEINGVMQGSANVTFIHENEFDTAETAGSGSFGTADLAYAGIVTYQTGIVLYDGTYSTLILDGTHTLNDKNVSVTTKAVFNGRQTITGITKLTLSGSNEGTNAEIVAGGASVITYNGSADQGVYGGTYGELNIVGNHDLANDFTVENTATLSGVMSGEADVTFKGNTSGDGTFGSDADNRYKGVVTYYNNNIFGGFYNGTKDAPGLVINEAGTVASGVSVDAASVALTGTLTVDGSILFSGYTDALVKGDAARVAGAGSIGYKSTADIYGGEYNNLEIYGDHYFASSLTVKGTTTIYDNDNGTDASLTGDAAAELVFKGGVTGNGAYFGDGVNAFAGRVTYESSDGEILSGIYTDLTVTSSNTVVDSLKVEGMLDVRDGVTLSGSGDWIISITNASAKSTGVIENTATVTYNGLLTGEHGWIYGGEYANLIIEGGDYSVGAVSIDGTFSGSGKLVFTSTVSGSGIADNANADYMASNTLYAGTYNDLGIGAGVEVPNGADVTVNGVFSALNNSAVVGGFGTLEIAGTMVGFESLGRFSHNGQVIFSGNALYNVNGGTAGNTFVTLTVKNNATLELANSQFEALNGNGNVNIGANVVGSTLTMTGGTVTYTAAASTTLLDGTYYNLVLNQAGANVEVGVGATVTVNGLLNVNGHNIENLGDLNIYTFTGTAGTAFLNLGKVTFGSSDPAVGAPAVRQVWEGDILNGYENYNGELVINRANYELASLYNFGTVTVAASAAATSVNDVVKLGVYSNFDSVFNLASDVVIYDFDDVNQFTNRGTVNISGSWGAFSNFHIHNLTQSTINVTQTGGGKFVFGENIKLTNSGLVKAGSGGKVKFVEVNENLSGRPVYQTAGGGEFYFEFASDSINIANGLLGELKNHEGTMYFLTDGMKYLGKLTNGNGTRTSGEVYIHADSTFKESVTSTYGLIQVGNGTDEVTVNFLHNVGTGSRFEIQNNAEAVFEAIVGVVHEFYMEAGSSALFMDEVRISSTTSNKIDTVFHVKAGADATFLGDIFNQNGYGFHERDGWEVNDRRSGENAHNIKGTFSSESAVYTDSVISSNDWECDSEYLSKFIIDGHIVVNGKFSNIAYGWGSDDHQANVVVNSSNNVFGAIDNRGSAARLDMNGSNNQFNGTIFNTGNLYLNGTNDYNDIQTVDATISFKISSTSYSDKTPNNGYVWVNDGADGSTFRKISVGGSAAKGASNPTFTVVSYNNAGINLTFTDTVVNKGRFNINADGSVFDRAVTNYNEFRVYGVAQFNDLFTNQDWSPEDVAMAKGDRLIGAELSIGAAGTRFNRIVNDGVIGINAYTILEATVTNRGTLNLNVSNLEFSDIDNEGVINLHSAMQTVIRNLTIGQSSVIDIDKNSSLHLQVVSEDYAGNYDRENYDPATDSKLGTIYVRGDQRNGIYDNHNTPNVSDTEHGLFFEDTGAEQTISSRILYDTTSIESSVWFTNNTVLKYEDASWIIIRDGESVTLSVIGSTEKYKVLTGGELIVKEVASGTRFQVNGGTLLFDNDVIALTITGLVEVRSGSAVFGNAQSLTFTRNVVNNGTMTFSDGSNTVFNAGLTNQGTVEAYTNLSSNVLNTGTYAVMGGNVSINSNLNNTNGTLSVVGTAQLLADVGGKVSVQEGGTLSVAVDTLSSELTNNGTVSVNNPGSSLTVSGNVLKGSGTFTGSAPAELIFTGDIETGTSAVFDTKIVNVEYAGTASASQNIILGTYNNLILNGSLKVVDDGTVTVNGTFTNNDGVKVTNDGELILNRSMAGNGSYANEGTLTFGNNASGTVNGTVNNQGTVNVDGNIILADLNNAAAGSVNANGTLKAAGVNTGSIVVNGNMTAENLDNPGSVKVAESGRLTLSDNALLGGTIENAGNIIANADNSAFGSFLTNNGTLTVNGKNATFDGHVNDGTIALKGSNADLNGAVNRGTIALRNEDVNIYGLNNDGVLEIHVYNGMDLTRLDNRDGLIEFHIDTTVTDDITQGRVAVGGGHELTLKMDEVNGSYNANEGTLVFEAMSAKEVTVNSDMSINSQGTLKLNSAVSIYGDFELYGKIDTQDNDLTFEGSTSGTGRVTGNASNTVTYGENAALIYQGEYANLVVRGASAVDADSEVTVNQTMYNGDSLTVDGRLVLNGATAGRGTVNGGSGEIVYNGNGAEQSIYAGLYNDLTIGEDAVGNIDIAGDITINGNAFNRSLRGAELAVSNGTVTYNAAGAQHVMGGTYDELILTGSGTKLMEADLFNVNDFVAGGSSFSNMLTLTSAAPGSLWTLNADSYSINYSIVNYADSYNSVFLNGTNLTGSFNTNNWAVFNSAGGVGSSYPGINNPNFQALAAYMDQLSFEWSDSSRFDAFRRLPVSRPAIVVGDMSDLVMLNSFESYDMIDFDGEFFGNSDGIGLLDEESREVLEDAVSAGGSDLKALLED